MIGNAEFNLPKLEPFRVKYVETETVGGTSNFYLKSTLKDVDIHGLTSGKLSRTATKFNKSYGLRVEGFVDKIQIIGDYTMNGKILVLPINGEGKCNVTMTNVTCFIDSRGKYFERDGETFLNITHFTLKLTPQHVTYYFANLFKNDQKLSATINDFMNEQWKLVTDNLLPPYMTRIGDMFADISNKIFNNIPFNKIFLE